MTADWGRPDYEELCDELKSKKALIVALDAAILAVISGSQSYSTDTGQTRITVTKANLTEARKALAEARARVADINREMNGTTAYVARPAF